MIRAAFDGNGNGCWKRIGVSGDRSCPELVTHVHCRNCPTYADAAQRTLHRPVDPAYRAASADYLRQSPGAAAPSDAGAMVFRIGREWLAVPASMAISVAPMAPAHRIPHRNADGLLGVVNVGGRLLPAVSLAAVLGIDDTDDDVVAGRHVFARLLVIDVQGQHCAAPVAELRGMVRYSAAGLAVPAPTVERPRPHHLAGVLAHASLQVGVLNGPVVARALAELLR
jgi:chemotaxis-related protein WspD